MDQLEQRIAQAMTEDSMKLQLRNAGVFRFSASYRFERHNHKEIEIIYIKSGHCIIGCGETFVPMQEGDCIILYKGVPHWFFVDKKESCQIAQLEFSITVPEYLVHALAFFRGKQFCRLSDCDMVEEMIESISRLYRLGKAVPHGSLQMKLMFFRLFIDLSAKMETKKETGRNGKIDEIIAYISEHYEYDIRVEGLAEQFGVSSRYIRRCFKEEAGISCSQYITSLRIEKAKEMLWLSAKTVTEIASLTGFNSSQYFSRVFQQYTGQTPLECRNSWRGVRAAERCVIEEELS